MKTIYLLITILITGQTQAELQILQPIKPTEEKLKIDNINSKPQRLAELKKAAKRGETRAQFSLASAYHNGTDVKIDEKLALYWYLKVAQKGYASAQFNVANSYYYGVGTSKSTSKAFEWYQKAAKQGFATAQHNLATMYHFGNGTKKDKKKAFAWYQKAAKLNHVLSQTSLAYLYEIGMGTNKDLKLAYTWYEKAAKQNNGQAQFYFARFLLTQKRSKLAFSWYEKAANQEYTKAQSTLAKLYRTGKGVKKDDKKSLYWALLAAKKENAQAQFLAGVIYRHSKSIIFDAKKAAFWHQKAAKNGHIKAQYTFATLCLKGDGIKKDLNCAVSFYQKAAKQGLPAAQYSLALRYLRGEGVKKNYPIAVKWLTQAAQSGHALAQYSLALRYKLGQGVDKNIEKATYWYQQSAEQGNTNAQYALALIQINQQDLKNALPVLLDLSDKGHKIAQYTLYQLYTQDNLIRKNTQLAQDYLLKSASQGYANAQYQLGKQEFEQKRTAEAQQWLMHAAQQQYIPAKKLLARINKAKLTKKTQLAALSQLIKEPSVKIVPNAPIQQSTISIQQKPTASNPTTNKAPTVTVVKKIITPTPPQQSKKKPTQARLKSAPTLITKKPNVWRKSPTITPPTQAQIAQSLNSAQVLKTLGALNTQNNQQSPIEFYNLSKIYLEGALVDKDEQTAFMLMYKSAYAGLPKAQNALAIMHMQGIGTPIDYKKAYRWADINAKKGSLESKKILKQIIFIFNQLK
jgi:TPR repeat protein